MMEKSRNMRMEAIIGSAAELFLRRGIDCVKMTDIADESGIGVASLYRYWGTKTAIAVRVATDQWKRVRALFDDIFKSDSFAGSTGADQIRTLLEVQIMLFREHKDFLKFLYEFDAYLVREKVPRNELADYEKSVLNFYPLFEQACRRGVSDGSVRADLDFGLIFKSLSHALMNLSQRFIIGEILPSDDFSTAENELRCLIDMANRYIRN